MKHLPIEQWPVEDLKALTGAFEPGDIFDEDLGAGAHLSEGSRRKITFSYRRWLGFLKEHDPAALGAPLAERVTRDRVRAYVNDLAPTNRPTSIAIQIEGLFLAIRLMYPSRNWSWLQQIGYRVAANGRPLDRFDRLAPPWRVLDLGLDLMDTADELQGRTHKALEVQFRDGLLIAILSLCPLRRRSLAALSVSGHFLKTADGYALLLPAEDTKAHRSEEICLPGLLTPYLERYLSDIRPKLLRADPHDMFWVSWRGRPLCDAQIYDKFRYLTGKAFGKGMALHHMRRSAATHLAIDCPDKVGLIPAVLQHKKMETSEAHYNLANSARASSSYVSLIKSKRKTRRVKETS
ncbi:hypothetical protein ROS1_34610 [Roseibium sp. ROS1]